VTAVTTSEGRGTDRGTDRIRVAMALALGGMAAVHLAMPEPFEQMIPAELGNPQAWNWLATAAEATSAVLLARRSTARLGGWLAFMTFLVVWVAHFEDVRQGGIAAGPGLLGTRTVAVARVALQVPLLMWAWRIAHDETLTTSPE